MARRGFLSRLTGAIRRAFSGRPPERESPASPPEPPEFKGGQKRERQEERDFRNTWNRAGGHGSYSRNRDVFDSIPGVAESDHDEQIDLWDSYIRNMVNGHHRRNDPRNPFWSDIGIHPRDFDWDEFRRAMGY